MGTQHPTVDPTDQCYCWLLGCKQRFIHDTSEQLTTGARMVCGCAGGGATCTERHHPEMRANAHPHNRARGSRDEHAAAQNSETSESCESLTGRHLNHVSGIAYIELQTSTRRMCSALFVRMACRHASDMHSPHAQPPSMEQQQPAALPAERHLPAISLDGAQIQ